MVKLDITTRDSLRYLKFAFASGRVSVLNDWETSFAQNMVNQFIATGGEFNPSSKQRNRINDIARKVQNA